jgi:hypothetical protein
MSAAAAPEFVSIGPYCETSMILDQQGLRRHAYPFDFIFSSLAIVRHCIGDAFATFLDKSQYRQGDTIMQARHAFYCSDAFLGTPVLYKHHAAHYTYPYIPERVNIFNHHTPLYCRDHYDAFVRRAERFMKLFEATQPVVFVYFNRYTTEFDDLVDFYKSVAKYPHIHVLGIFQNDGEQTILYEEGRCKLYQNYVLERIFAEVMTHYSVVT